MKNYSVVGYSVSKDQVEISSHRGYLAAYRSATKHAGATMLGIDIKRIWVKSGSPLNLTDYQNKVDGFTVL